MNGVSCKDSGDCSNNAICTMTYADKNKTVPLGRFCKGGENPENEIVTCKVDSDCPKGDCKVIQNEQGQFIGRQCINKDGTALREGDYKKVDPTGKKYPHISNIDRINLAFEQAEAGPVAKMIAELINLIFGIVEQMLTLAKDIFFIVFKSFGGPLLQTKGDLSVLMLDTITKRIIPNKGKNNCYSFKHPLNERVFIFV